MSTQAWEVDPVLISNVLIVFVSDLSHPFNNWNHIHGSQGFSWRPGTVSFGTIDTDGYLPVPIHVADTYTLPMDALRAIKVPFEVGTEGITISDTIYYWQFPVPQGHYMLFFTIEPAEKSWKYALTFVPTETSVEAEIMRGDAELTPPENLLMDAEPI